MATGRGAAAAAVGLRRAAFLRGGAFFRAGLRVSARFLARRRAARRFTGRFRTAFLFDFSLLLPDFLFAFGIHTSYHIAQATLGRKDHESRAATRTLRAPCANADQPAS